LAIPAGRGFAGSSRQPIASASGNDRSGLKLGALPRYRNRPGTSGTHQGQRLQPAVALPRLYGFVRGTVQVFPDSLVQSTDFSWPTSVRPDDFRDIAESLETAMRTMAVLLRSAPGWGERNERRRRGAVQDWGRKETAVERRWWGSRSARCYLALAMATRDAIIWDVSPWRAATALLSHFLNLVYEEQDTRGEA